MTDHSAVFNAHPQYIETLYQNWLKNPESVTPGLGCLFQGF
jgi:2-oxoglutarate dehydrogenase complex dehydrogenase (E1) component-like enzyme